MRGVLTPSTWNPESLTVEVVWSAGADVRRRDPWTGAIYIERLDMTPGAVDLTRLNAGAPVLNAHESCELGDIIGVVVPDSAVVENGECRAVVQLSARPEIAGIVADVAAGIIRNVSFGYEILNSVATPATPASPEIRTVTSWLPYEISFVPIPADPQAQSRSHPSPSIPAPAASAASQETRMSATTTTPETVPPAAPPAVDANAIRQAEQARARDILVVAEQAGMESTWAREHIAAGTAIDTVRAQALETVASQGARRVNPRSQVIVDEGDTQRRLLANALEHRGHVPGVQLEEGARQFRGYRMVDFARHAIELAGGNHRGLTPHETFREAFRLGAQNRLQRAAPAHATGDFPDLLANTASKMLRQAYGSAPRSFVPWTRQVNLPDFKSFKAVSLGGTSALARIEEDAEVTFGTVDDNAESWNLVRYGKALAISYVALINDDMSGFTRVPQMFGMAAARLESTTVYGVLTANAALADSVALFHSTHANTSTGVLSVDATGVANVAAAQTKLRVQTAPNGDILGLTGRYLIVPAALEVKAAQLFSPAIVAGSAGAVNPMSLQVIGEPRLDATSAVAYYVIADPNEIDTIHWGYLDGEDGPVITSDVLFDTDGMVTKVMHNFGAAAIDYRGMVYSTGA